MNIKRNLIKKISFLIIISILSSNLLLAWPQEAKAVLGVADTAVVYDPVVSAQLTVLNGQTAGKTFWDKAESYLLKALASTAKLVAKRLISNITVATVDWINGGMKKPPSYVSHPLTFIAGEGGVLDQAVGDFFASSELGFLCDPFRIQVQLALQLGYGSSFQDRIGCTFTRIRQNINNAQIVGNVNLNVNGNVINGTVSKFASQGGWDAWLTQNVQPQNNPQGAYLIAKENMDAGIVNAKGEKVLDFSFGQGALSFNSCVDTYYDSTGAEIGKSAEYTEGGAKPSIPSNLLAPAARPQQNSVNDIGSLNTIPTGYYSKTKTNCAVKTPGSIITGMLTQKATTDVRQSELTAALSDGLDAIFGALANALLAKALGQLNNGVLGNNKTADDAYNSAISNSWASSLLDYNNNINNLNNEWNNIDWSNISFSTSTPVFDTSSLDNLLAATGTGFNTITTTNTYTALDQAKANALALIKSITNSEQTYQNNYLTALNLLTEARNVFASSSDCNLTYNRFDSVLRSALIKSNVVTNIEGNPDTDRTIASIPWNFKTIATALDGSKAHMLILNKTTSDVNNSGSISAVKDAMTLVNSTSFNSDVQSTLVENVKTWIRGVGDTYNSNICTINLVNVLKINTGTTTVSTQ